MRAGKIEIFYNNTNPTIPTTTMQQTEPIDITIEDLFQILQKFHAQCTNPDPHQMPTHDVFIENYSIITAYTYLSLTQTYEYLHIKYKHKKGGGDYCLSLEKENYLEFLPGEMPREFKNAAAAADNDDVFPPPPPVTP
jgi:hypothetical protein